MYGDHIRAHVRDRNLNDGREMKEYDAANFLRIEGCAVRSRAGLAEFATPAELKN